MQVHKKGGGPRCDQCGLAFVSEGSLRRHLEAVSVAVDAENLPDKATSLDCLVVGQGEDGEARPRPEDARGTGPGERGASARLKGLPGNVRAPPPGRKYGKRRVSVAGNNIVSADRQKADAKIADAKTADGPSAVEVVTLGSSYSCDLCDYDTDQFRRLAAHCRKRHGLRAADFTTKFYAKRSYAYHCDDCGFETPARADFLRHRSEGHRNRGGRTTGGAEETAERRGDCDFRASDGGHLKPRLVEKAGEEEKGSEQMDERARKDAGSSSNNNMARFKCFVCDYASASPGEVFGHMNDSHEEALKNGDDRGSSDSSRTKSSLGSKVKSPSQQEEEEVVEDAGAVEGQTEKVESMSGQET